jgi:hypothetical protein
MELKENLPLLLRRKHVKELLGISDTLYYNMVNNNVLPTIYYNERVYVHRDRFFALLDLLRGDVQKHED